MKKLILLICMLAGMSSCYHEDALIVPEQPDKYNILTDDPSDPTQHFIYQFYQKYQTVIITNPTEADYKFNFTANNGIKITAPEQKQEIIDEGIEFLQKVLLNLYSDSFLKKNLPFSILLSEEVRMASYGETTIMNCYASSSFIALGNVSSSLKTMTDEEFDEYFDNGGDITPFIVEDSVEFPNRNDKARKVNISMPEWMIEELDATARHFATTRQGVINMWIGERLENERRKTMA